LVAKGLEAATGTWRFCVRGQTIQAAAILPVLMRLIQNAQTAADLPETLISMGIVAGLTFPITVNAGMVTS
jgi:hypothetical protein